MQMEKTIVNRDIYRDIPTNEPVGRHSQEETKNTEKQPQSLKSLLEQMGMLPQTKM